MHKRGKMHLIDGQPLHLLSKTEAAPKLPPNKKSKHAHSASTFGIQHFASTAKAAINTFPMGLSSSGPVASSSKRALPPLPTEEPSSKKKKVESAPSSCVVCGRSPFHLVKDCPTVLEGPKRYDFDGVGTNLLTPFFDQRLQGDQETSRRS